MAAVSCCFVAQSAYRRTLIPSSHDETFLVFPRWDSLPPFFHFIIFSYNGYILLHIHIFETQKNLIILRCFPKAPGSSTPLRKNFQRAHGCPMAVLQARSATILHFSCFYFISFFFFTLPCLMLHKRRDGIGRLYRNGNGIMAEKDWVLDLRGERGHKCAKLKKMRK